MKSQPTRMLSTLVILVAVGVLGCAPWKKEPSKKSALVIPNSRIAPDAVGLEIAVAQLDLDQAESFESYWRLLDEQELSLDFRKRLDANGLRAAVMASNPPRIFQDLVEPRPINVEELSPFQKQLHEEGRLKPKTRMVSHSRISNREGQDYEVSISDIHPQVSWTVRNRDQQSPGSGEFVRGTMSVTTYPRGDGSVRLVLRPKIHHGKSRKRINDAFLLQSSQRVKTIADLKMDIVLRAGESVVIAPTSDVTEMGHVLFGIPQSLNPEEQAPDNSAVGPLHRMLVIRVVQTQMDDLFNDSGYEKLTTTPKY